MLAPVKHEQDNKSTCQSANQKQILSKAMSNTTQDVVSTKLTSGIFRTCTQNNADTKTSTTRVQVMGNICTGELCYSGRGKAALRKMLF